tara:strand:- start:181 stop:1113 length:933 start_codon:yes stop_codon:yes gene_type:complete
MDWRQNIRDNKKRTLWVLITFVLLYVLIGLLLDWFFLAERALDHPKHTLSAGTSLHALQSLVTFKRIPYFTLGMGAFALLAIAWTRLRSQRMLLIGTQHREITANSTQAKDIQLFNLLTEMQLAAGLRYTPKLFVIETNTLNAFASGWNEKSFMIAISKGLMDALTRQEMQAVIAHELSHIRNQDIKLMLTVTVLSNIMLLVVGILFNSMLYGPRRNNSNNQQNNQALLWVVVIILRFVGRHMPSDHDWIQCIAFCRVVQRRDHQQTIPGNPVSRLIRSHALALNVKPLGQTLDFLYRFSSSGWHRARIL